MQKHKGFGDDIPQAIRNGDWICGLHPGRKGTIEVAARN